MTCEKCGYMLSHEDLFCPNCGHKIKLEKGIIEEIKKFVNKIKFNWFNTNNPIKILMIFLIVGAIIGTFGIYKEYNKKKEINRFTPKIKEGYSNLDSQYEYSNSTYKIGSTMPAGEYVLFAISDNGYFALTSESSGSNIIQNNIFDYNSIIRVKDGEYLELRRCYAEPIDSSGSIKTTGSGMFKVGTHLSAGEYQIQATEPSGYFCVYDDDRQDKINNNGIVTGTSYVAVQIGEYLELKGCKIIK